MVTLDRDGALLLPDDGSPTHRTFARPAPEANTCGAGDTFTAALDARAGRGTPAATAVELAQAAADVVVGRPATSVCGTGELAERVAAAEGPLLDAASLATIVHDQRVAGRRVVFTNGCFDVVHRGHVASLNQAKRLGDVLVVALNSDESVARLKGPERPLNPLADRAAVIGALSCVDHVTAFDADTPAELLDLLRPDVYAKGGDYTPEMLRETATVTAYGGRVVILDYLPDRSTTSLVDRIRSAVVIDVLIPTRGRPVELATTLAGLAAQTGRGVPGDDLRPVRRRPLLGDAVGVDGDPLAAPARDLGWTLHRHLPPRGMAEQRAFLLSCASAPAVLYLDDDVWLEPGVLARLHRALGELGCGVVGRGDAGARARRGPAAARGDVVRAVGRAGVARRRWSRTGRAGSAGACTTPPTGCTWPSRWTSTGPGRPTPSPESYVPYKVAWAAGCVLFDRAALVEAGGFEFWRDLPPDAHGEDVHSASRRSWRAAAAPASCPRARTTRSRPRPSPTAASRPSTRSPRE